MLGVELAVSVNGGRDFRVLKGPHVDHQGLWIDPKADVLYNCNDGGIYLSADAGATWKFKPAPSTLVYNVALDMATPFHAYASVQDHVSYRVTIDVARGRARLPASAFEQVPGGERTYHAIDPANSDILFIAPVLTAFVRADLSTSPPRRTNIGPRPLAGAPRIVYDGSRPSYCLCTTHPRFTWHRSMCIARRTAGRAGIASVPI